MAFAASSTVRLRCGAAPPRRVCNRRTKPRSDLSAGAVIFDAVALGAVIAGATYVYRSSFADKSADDQLVVAPKEEDKGILGLMGDSRSSPLPAKFARPVGRPLAEVADSAVDVLPNVAERRAEELSLALGNLGDLGEVSVVVFDGGKSVLLAEGKLIVDGAIGNVVEAGVVARRDDAGDFPFLDKQRTNSVAAYPLGETGGVMVVASEEKGFFGEMEERVGKAVAGRLSAFIPVQIPNVASLEGNVLTENVS